MNTNKSEFWKRFWKIMPRSAFPALIGLMMIENHLP
jgi:hypothetical protein